MPVDRPARRVARLDPVLRRARRRRARAGRRRHARSRASGAARSSSTSAIPGDALFIIMAGEVKISLPSESRGRGDPRPAPARATSSASWPCSTARRARRRPPRSVPIETVVLPRDRFRELIADEPAVRDALLASLAAELRRLTTHVEELHFLDITGRLAACLVRLAADGGTRARRRRDPAADVAHPGRPRGDGRQHPTEREQAARPVHRRRVPPPRARRASSSPTSRACARASRR